MIVGAWWLFCQFIARRVAKRGNSSGDTNEGRSAGRVGQWRRCAATRTRDTTRPMTTLIDWRDEGLHRSVSQQQAIAFSTKIVLRKHPFFAQSSFFIPITSVVLELTVLSFYKYNPINMRRMVSPKESQCRSMSLTVHHPLVAFTFMTPLALGLNGSLHLSPEQP